MTLGEVHGATSKKE